MFARSRKARFWWLMRRVIFALSAMLFLCPVVIRSGGGIRKNKLPSFTYTGTYSLLDDGDGNRRIKFLTSGTLIFAKNVTVDLFLVGGGASGGTGDGTYNGGSGGGSGYTATYPGVVLEEGVSYNVVVGAGGAAVSTFNSSGNAGGKSYFHYSALYFANGGGAGKNGGSGAGNGGTSADGQAGASDGASAGGSGQGTTTREFGSSAGTLYSGAGGGGKYRLAGTGGAGGAGGGGKGGDALNPSGIYDGYPGTVNTGGGGGGNCLSGKGAAGGSGICILRNHSAA